MKTISMINLKGGVAKTISAINFAYILAGVYGLRVLLIDNDKQGNASRFFDLYDYECATISEIMTETNFRTEDAIYNTKYERLHVIPSNLLLLTAIQRVAEDKDRPQQIRLAMALNRVQSLYDYCIIDNPPDINLSVINALAATDDVLVPLRADMFSFDGLETIAEQIESIKRLNKSICFKGCFLTMYQKNFFNNHLLERLRSNTEYPVFNTIIRHSVKAAETTYTKKPLLIHSKWCSTAKDYIALVDEYLSK